MTGMSRFGKVTLSVALGLAAVAVAGGVAAVGARPDGGPAAERGTVRPAATGPVSQPRASETRYVPVTPCTVLSTARAKHALAGGAEQKFLVSGTAGFPAQGGKSGGCGVPVGASAVAATFVVSHDGSSGNVHFWPTGTSEPNPASLVFTKGVSASGSAPLAIAAGTSAQVAVRNTASKAVQLAVSVSGYYVKPLAGTVSPGGDLYAGSSRMISATQLDTGYYAVTFDRDVRDCAATATAYLSGDYISTDTYIDSNTHTVRVQIYNASGNAVNQYFYISVEC